MLWDTSLATKFIVFVPFHPSTSSGRTGLEQSREVLSAAFTAEPDEASGRTGWKLVKE
jgi:hypothetical protein